VLKVLHRQVIDLGERSTPELFSLSTSNEIKVNFYIKNDLKDSHSLKS
jgi:hypothetical protein